MEKQAMEKTQVILVDEHDQTIGLMEKMEAHRRGLLHRAVSVFVFDGSGRLLLQQRATHKYHSGGLWTNTCCSHPFPGEDTAVAAARRLEEEMGLSLPLDFAFSFRYRAVLDNGLTEHELDHVFIGYTDQSPDINPEEAAAYRWISSQALEKDLAINASSYTAWFKLIYRRAFELINS